MKLGKLMIASVLFSSSCDGIKDSAAAFGKLDQESVVSPTVEESQKLYFFAVFHSSSDVGHQLRADIWPEALL